MMLQNQNGKRNGLQHIQNTHPIELDIIVTNLPGVVHISMLF